MDAGNAAGGFASPVRAALTPTPEHPLVSDLYIDTLAEAFCNPRMLLSPPVSDRIHTVIDPPSQPNVARPLVSYLYLDTLAGLPSQPNVVSPLVSYLFNDSVDLQTLAATAVTTSSAQLNGTINPHGFAITAHF